MIEFDEDALTVAETEGYMEGPDEPGKTCYLCSAAIGGWQPAVWCEPERSWAHSACHRRERAARAAYGG